MPIGTFTPPPGKSITQFFFPIFFYFFFHFRCILLQISHQKCFFISISIPGRSGVNTDTKMWEKGQIQHLTDQPSQYSVIFESGRIANRNRVHPKLDRTVSLTLSPDNPDKNVPTTLLPDMAYIYFSKF